MRTCVKAWENSFRRPGTLVYHQKRPHTGVLFFRLRTETSDAYTSRLADVLKTYHAALTHHYIVITDEHVRIR